MISRRALHANVVINSLDAKGLYTEDLLETGMGASVRSITQQQVLGSRPKEDTNSAMGNLADSTGGLFFHNSNDLSLGFRDLGMQPEVSYLLAFAPPAPDGKFHRLKVSLTKARHEHVQARPGYMSVAVPAEKPAVERAIDREVLSGRELNDVPVQWKRGRTSSETGKPLARLAFVWDVGKMPFRRRGTPTP
jgi:hypothetical protein